MPPGKLVIHGPFKLLQSFEDNLSCQQRLLSPILLDGLPACPSPPPWWASLLAAGRETTLITQYRKSLSKKDPLGLRHYDSIQRTGYYHPMVLGLGNNCQKLSS